MSSSVKTALRAEVKAVLRALSAEEVETKSSAVVRRLLASSPFAESKVVCCYLSMPGGEVKTSSIITSCLAAGKRVFVPKVLGKRPADMRMFELESEAQLQSFPKSAWGIPEPSSELVLASPDGCDLGIIDLVLVPGVAFDRSCNRLGHGKGYYDCFLERLLACNAAKAGPVPTFVGLGFDEQLVATVPSEAHDRPLDLLVTPSEVFAGPDRQGR